MTTVSRLVTVVDIDDGHAATNDDCSMSLSAVHVAVLQEDHHRVVLLEDRGWGVSGPPGIWSHTSVYDVERAARVVVGPDEPFDIHSQTDMEWDHWESLSEVLRQQDVFIAAEELRRLPHTVELTQRLRTRLVGT